VALHLGPPPGADESPSGLPVEAERVHLDRVRGLYEAYLEAIYRYIYTRVGNREDAEDLTAQVYLKAIRSLDGGRDEQPIRGWLFHVARTTIADHWRWFYQLRARSLDELLASGWDGPPQEPAGELSQAPQDRVQRLLRKLPPRYRDVLTSRFLFNASIKETAALMGLSEGAVKVLQFRALKKAGQLEGTE
jgi:RNA polymerase sigma-70 factor, ECF subfamily